MCDIFLSEDLRRVLEGKKVVFMGDSNIRSFYKDMLCLFHHSSFISKKDLVAKMENSVFGDNLEHHGEKSNSRQYMEERVFDNGSHRFEYYFLTRVYNKYVEQILHKITAEKQPDVVVINSCLWDLARWGPTGVEEFKVNIVKLMKQLRALLNDDCLVIWATAPPLAGRPYGGFLLVELDFLKYSLRFHVMEANVYARKVAEKFGFDVLDIHYHLRMQTHRRCPDGMHWPAIVVRYITNLFLTHICLAWGVDLPNRHKPKIAEKSLQAEKMCSDEEIENVAVDTVGDVICISESPKPTKQTKLKKPLKKKLRRKKRQRVQPYVRPRPPLLAVPNSPSYCPPNQHFGPIEYHGAQPEPLYDPSEFRYAQPDTWDGLPESHYAPPNPWDGQLELRHAQSNPWGGSSQSRYAPSTLCYSPPRYLHDPPSSCFAQPESCYAPHNSRYDPPTSCYDPSESLNDIRYVVAHRTETISCAVNEPQHRISKKQLYAASLDHNPSFWQNNLPHNCLF